MNNIYSFSIYGLILSPAISVAAESLATEIETIVVTAQKREQAIQDVPMTLNVLRGNEFKELAIRDTDDIVQQFPNLGTNPQSAYNSGISIRGVGTDNFHISTQQSVGTYIDDVSMVSPFINTIGVYDMERVEVLRGPQNTLYGRNTTGGAVVWHTQKATPGKGMNGYVDVSTGSGNLIEMEGAIGLAVNDTMAIRLSAMKDSYDGLWNNMLNGEDTGGGYDRHGVRANFVWTMSDRTSLDLTAVTGRQTAEDFGFCYRGNLTEQGTADPEFTNHKAEDCFNVGGFVYTSATQVQAFDYLADQFANNTGKVILNPASTSSFDSHLVDYSVEKGQTFYHPESKNIAQWDGFRVNLSHALNFAELTVLASYDETYLKAANIPDLTGLASNQEGKWDVVQLETRLTSTTNGPVSWLIGLYYMDEDSQQDTWLANTKTATYPGIIIDSRYSNLAAYGQFDWAATEQLNLTLGLRYTKDNLKGDWRKTVCKGAETLNHMGLVDRDVRDADCLGYGLSGTPSQKNPQQKLSELGWRVGADYSISNQLMAYANASKGFKGGAYDNRALGTGDSPIGPEYLNAYEVGFKSNLLNNTLQLNAAYFWYDWEGQQLFDAISGLPYLINIDQTKVQGMDFSAQYAFNHAWYAEVGIGTLHTEITDTSSAPPNAHVMEGQEVTNSPDLTGNALLSYTRDLASGQLNATITYRYVSDYFYTFDQDTLRAEAPSQNYLNVSGSYRFGNTQKHTILVYAKNLTEEFHCANIQNGPGIGANYSCRIGSYGERLFGVGYRADF